jgi:large subunit ribosomal protein L35
MPKMKTRSSAKKRFKKLGSGKVKRSKAFRRHLFSRKTKKTKRHLRKATLVNAADLRNVLRLLPY